MSYKALLFCPDEKTARTVTQVLTELDFQVEPSNEPFATVKKLTAEHFDALVVDCENEQNATLLFKSARNSELNQASLSIAVVEGQAGVAKAFRIGANLVLTKPINVEQSKGTIRVARGLLRKSELSRPAAGSANVDSKQDTAPPRIPVSSSSSSIPSSFELENEPEPQPEPTEAALLESMPDPAADLGRLAASAHAQASPWQPIAKPTAAPQSAVADSDERKELLESLLASAKTVSSASPTGAAAAPARQKSATSEQVQRSVVELPSFASTAEKPVALRPAQSGSGKKIVLVAAAVLVAAVIGYAGWTKLSSGAHSSSAQKPGPQTQSVQAPSAVPATPVATEQSPSSAPETTPELAAIPASPNAASTSISKDLSPSKSKKSAIASTDTDASSEEESDVTVKLPSAIVVKKGEGKPVSHPVASEQADAAAPALNIDQSSQPDAVAGLVDVSPTLPKSAPQTLKISQGVSQGLLVKKVAPVYPQQALQMKIQGAVEIAAIISKQGNITNLKILSGDPILGRAALDAVKQWKYKPYYLDSQPVDIQTQVTVVFKLP
ncbi:MAG: TonB family protein [Acidobacteriaceae bacterium]|nr:TonB family protein [Acidobacteriaceae bacterium]